MVAPTGEGLELLAVDVQPSAWDDSIVTLRAGIPHTAWTVDDLDAAHARARVHLRARVRPQRDMKPTMHRLAVCLDKERRPVTAALTPPLLPNPAAAPDHSKSRASPSGASAFS